MIEYPKMYINLHFLFSVIKENKYLIYIRWCILYKCDIINKSVSFILHLSYPFTLHYCFAYCHHFHIKQAIIIFIAHYQHDLFSTLVSSSNQVWSKENVSSWSLNHKGYIFPTFHLISIPFLSLLLLIILFCSKKFFLFSKTLSRKYMKKLSNLFLFFYNFFKKMASKGILVIWQGKDVLII